MRGRNPFGAASVGSGTGVNGTGVSETIAARRVCPFRLVPLVAFVGLAAALAGCGGSSSPAGGSATPAGSAPAATAPGAAQQAAAPQTGGAPTANACALVTAADLHSLGVSGPGKPQKITRGAATVYACTWGGPSRREFHLQFEAVDPGAARQVRLSLGGQGAVVPGVGDGARGQFGSLLAAVNFSKGTTFVAMELFGTGTGGHKGAFLAVAKNVASRV